MNSLTLTPITHGELCHGARWVVKDRDLLAEQIARVAMGQARHVSAILEGLEIEPPSTTKDHAINAKEKLDLTNDGKSWQRDGWIFQVISWLAALQEQPKNTVTAAPHNFRSHKGFDGLQLELSDDCKSVVAVVIFEDKATDNPRDTIRDEVWPDIEDLEQGKRVGELTGETTSLLEARQHKVPGLNIDQAIETIIWQQMRRYRVSITTGTTHITDQGRERLFGGYDKKVSGVCNRRKAETMHFDDLRTWMEDFSVLVLQKIDEIANV